MPRYYPRLRTRIMFIVIVATIPALALIFYNNLRYRQHQEIEARENALRFARLAAGNTEKSVEGARQLLISLSRIPAVRNASPNACNALLKDLLNHYQNYVLFGVADLRGDVMCNAFPFRGVVNIADRPYFQRALKTQDFSAGEYQTGRISRKATINFAYPVSQESGKMKAVVYSAMDLEWLNTLVSKIHLPDGGAIIVTDRNGTVLTHYPEAEKWTGKNRRGSLLVQTMLTHESEGVMEVPGVDGVPRIYGFTPVRTSDAGIYVGIGISKEAVSAEANRALVVNLLALGCIVVLSLGAAGFFSTAFIMRPVNALVSAAKRMASGDFSVRTGLVNRQDELGQLAQAFDHMAESVDRHIADCKRTEEALRESEGRYRAMVEKQAEAVCRWLPDSTLTFVNEGYCRSFGKKREELLGTQWFSLVPESSRDAVREVYVELAANPKVITYEHEVIGADGEIHWQQWTDCPLTDETGRVVEFQSVGRDITERKHAEEERERLILEHLKTLAKVNTLSGLLPICSSCKKIRDDEGYWQQIEDYISKHSEAEFSHGLCPECMEKMYPEYRKVDR